MRGMRPAGAVIEQPLWSILRVSPDGMSVRELRDLTKADETAVRFRLESWRRAGLVHVDGHHYGKRYSMNRNVEHSITPPKVDAGGQAVKRLPNGRQRLWIAMRILKSFDYPTLQMSAQVERGAAATYVTALVNAGYLRAISRRKDPLRTYVMIVRSGPKAPVLRQVRNGSGIRREIYDPNDGSTHDAMADGARGVNHVG